MVALDVMGGDFAPQASLAGALRAARNDIPILLCGPKDTLSAHLDELDPSWRSLSLELLHAPEIIEMDEEPVRAALKKQQSSIVQAVHSVRAGRASSVISAGNSGALMAAATFVLGKQDGIERPAIVGFLPGCKGKTLCLDLGANADCKPSYLLQFAHMGVDYWTKVIGFKEPRVGLLSNGSEPGKGSVLVKEAYKLIEQSELNFVGNVEPADVVNNKVDVLVCDGFAGNVLLKAVEASAEMLLSFLDEKQVKTVRKGLGLTEGGAQLLGVNGTVFVAHGASSEHDIANAIASAWNISKKI